MNLMIRNLRLLSISLLCSFLLYLLLLKRLFYRIGLQPQPALLTVMFIVYLAAVLFFWGRLILGEGCRRDARILLAMYGLLALLLLIHFSSGPSGFHLNPIGFLLALREMPAAWTAVGLQMLLFLPAPSLLIRSGVSRTFTVSLMLAMGLAVLTGLLQLILKRGFLSISDLLLYLFGLVLGYVLRGLKKACGRHAAESHICC